MSLLRVLRFKSPNLLFCVFFANWYKEEKPFHVSRLKNSCVVLQVKKNEEVVLL